MFKSPFNSSVFIDLFSFLFSCMLRSFAQLKANSGRIHASLLPDRRLAYINDLHHDSSCNPCILQGRSAAIRILHVCRNAGRLDKIRAGGGERQAFRIASAGLLQLAAMMPCQLHPAYSKVATQANALARTCYSAMTYQSRVSLARP